MNLHMSRGAADSMQPVPAPGANVRIKPSDDAMMVGWVKRGERTNCSDRRGRNVTRRFRHCPKERRMKSTVRILELVEDEIAKRNERRGVRARRGEHMFDRRPAVDLATPFHLNRR
jgi:hypothetical protein